MHCFPIQDLFYFAFRYLSDKNMFILCLNLTSAHFLGITKYLDKNWHSDSSKDYLRVTRASTRMYSIKRKCSRVTKFLSRRQEEVGIFSTNCQCRLSTGIRVRTPTRPHGPYVKLRNYQIRPKLNCFFSCERHITKHVSGQITTGHALQYQIELTNTDEYRRSHLLSIPISLSVCYNI